ncbi:hypothetical protein GCM10023080_065030 [Streptomyces pseudoechinosporeus]
MSTPNYPLALALASAGWGNGETARRINARAQQEGHRSVAVDRSRVGRWIRHGGGPFLHQGLAGTSLIYATPFEDTPFEIFDDSSFVVSTGTFTALGLLLVGFSAAGIVLAFRFVSGGPGLRGGGIAWGILGIVAALTMWFYAPFLVIPPLVTACLVIRRLADEESGDWFRRPRN